jgi:hypothetical protein
MAKKGHSAASRRQVASRSARNNVQRTVNVVREPRPERISPEPVEVPAIKRPTLRVDTNRMGKLAADSPTKALDASVQYPYVLNDLKQLGITAAAMFALMIVLALIIH